MSNFRHTGAALALIALAVAFSSGAKATSDPSVAIDRAIAQIVSDEAKDQLSAAKLLIGQWSLAMPALIDVIDRTDRTVDGRPYFDTDVSTLVRITDVLRAIVVNEKGGISEFRDNDTPATARVLAWASRDPDRNLRLNATTVLANTADNTNLCIVLHHLRDKDISPDGLANLTQVASAVASYAYQENVRSTRTTIRLLRNRLDEKEFAKTLSFVDILEGSVDNSSNARTPLPQSAEFDLCRDYDFNQTP
jgi:hypothetical protein